MYIIATASADTYITNKIVDGSRTEDANVGRAGTLDLFTVFKEEQSNIINIVVSNFTYLGNVWYRSIHERYL